MGVGGYCFWEGSSCAEGADWSTGKGVQCALPCASVSPRVSQFQARVWGMFLGCLTDPTAQLAHAIRLLLEYTETPYEDKLYSCGEGEGGQGVPTPPSVSLAFGEHTASPSSPFPSSS